MALGEDRSSCWAIQVQRWRQIRGFIAELKLGSCLCELLRSKLGRGGQVRQERGAEERRGSRVWLRNIGREGTVWVWDLRG